MKLKEIDKLKEEIKQILIDNKAIEIKSISLKDKTSIALLSINICSISSLS